MENINMKKLYLLIIITMIVLSSCTKNGFIVEKYGDITITYYYLNGKKITGWQKIEGEWYYFDDGGIMKCGTWLQEEKDYYYFDHDGKMLRNGAWKLDDGNIYYFASNGKMVHDTEKVIGGTKYIFDSNGKGKKAPYYSNSLWNVNIFIDNDLSEEIYISHFEVVAWKLYDLSMSIKPTKQGLVLCINGIAEYCKHESSHGRIHTGPQKPNIECRLTMTDDKVVTSSTSGVAEGSEISVGQKTYVSWEIKYLPLFGGNINASFGGPDWY